MSLGVGVFAASGGSLVLPTVAYTGKFVGINGFGGSTTSIPIGTAAADRLVIVMTYENKGSGSLNTRQVNGSNAIETAGISGNLSLSVFAKNIPTGTTTNLSWNTQFTSGISGVVFAVYGLTNPLTFQRKFNTGSATTTSNSIDVPAFGGAVGFRFTASGVNGAYGTSWSGLTLDTTTTGGANTADISAAHKTQINASTGLGISASTNYAGYMTLVSFGNG